MKKQQWIMAGVLFLILVLSRIVPHPANFTALSAVALFSGALWRESLFRFVVPLAAIIITDIYFGIYPGIEWTYLGIVASVLLAPNIEANLINVSLRAFVSAIVFFVFSNLGMWFSSGLYTRDMSGLGSCFTMAIPFFEATLVSAMFYSVVFFSFYRLMFFEKGFSGFIVNRYGR